MKIKVLDLTPADRTYKLEAPCSVMNVAFAGRDDIRCNGDAAVELTMSRIEEMVNLKGIIEVPAQIVCSRCLEEFDSSIRMRIRRVMKRDKSRNPEDEDVGYGFYDGDDLDLGQLVADHVGANLPSRVLCSPQCKGLCYICGTNLNETECGCKRD